MDSVTYVYTTSWNNIEVNDDAIHDHAVHFIAPVITLHNHTNLGVPEILLSAIRLDNFPGSVTCTLVQCQTMDVMPLLWPSLSYTCDDGLSLNTHIQHIDYFFCENVQSQVE